MMFRIRAFTMADADEVSSWRYEPPYKIYDVEADISMEDEMRDPARWGVSWFAVEDDGGSTVGFLELVDDGNQVEVGLGLRPDLTGRGLGSSFVEAGLAFAKDRWDPESFGLDVFPWNERAIRCYERAGFTRGDVYVRRFDSGNEVAFLRMTRPA